MRKLGIFICLLVAVSFSHAGNPTQKPYTTNTTVASGVIVALYNCDEGSGSTLNDSAGTANDGTLNSHVSWLETGMYNSALSFDGDSARVYVVHGSELATYWLTVQCWVYPIAFSGTQTIIQKDSSWAIEVDSSGQILVTLDSSGVANTWASACSLDAGKWTNLSVSYDGVAVLVWKDGVVSCDSMIAMDSLYVAGTAMIIGNNGDYSQGFRGYLDEIRIAQYAIDCAFYGDKKIYSWEKVYGMPNYMYDNVVSFNEVVGKPTWFVDEEVNWWDIQDLPTGLADSTDDGIYCIDTVGGMGVGLGDTLFFAEGSGITITRTDSTITWAASSGMGADYADSLRISGVTVDADSLFILATKYKAKDADMLDGVDGANYLLSSRRDSTAYQFLVDTLHIGTSSTRDHYLYFEAGATDEYIKWDYSNQRFSFSDDVEASPYIFSVAKLNTGLGDNELYAMNQNVQKTDTVRFAAVAFAPTTSPPASVQGQVYFNSDTYNLFCYNGSAWVDLTLTKENLQDTVGAMVSGNTTSGITVTYQDSDGTIDFEVSGITSAMITDGAIAESDLKVVDSPSDEDIFTYESTTGDFEWHSGAQVLTASGLTQDLGDISVVSGSWGVEDDSHDHVPGNIDLTSAYIIVGNVSNVGAGVAMSGDATIANTGAVTVADDSHNHVISNVDNLQDSLTTYIKATNDTMTGDLWINSDLIFNDATDETLKYNTTSDYFVFTDDIYVEGNTMQSGYQMYIDKDSSSTVPVLYFRGTEGYLQWTSSLSRFDFSDVDLYVPGNYKIWHAGNDGTGSTLDADLLDGAEGTAYLIASKDTATDLVIDSDLILNAATDETLRWSTTYGAFDFTDDMHWTGSLKQDGGSISIDDDGNAAAVIIYFADTAASISYFPISTAFLVDKDFVPNPTNTYDLGSVSYVWDSLFVGDVNASGNVICDALYLAVQDTPSTVTEGAMYYDSDNDNVYVYTSAGWVDLTETGTGGLYDSMSITADTFHVGLDTIGDAFIYFTTPGTDEYIKWDSTDAQFEVSDDIFSAANIIADTYLKCNGQYLYIDADSSSTSNIFWWHGGEDYMQRESLGTSEHFKISNDWLPSVDDSLNLGSSDYEWDTLFANTVLSTDMIFDTLHVGLDTTGDAYIYFTKPGADSYLMWDSTNSRFAFSGDLYSADNITANDYLKCNGQYLYIDADGDGSANTIWFHGGDDYIARNILGPSTYFSVSNDWLPSVDDSLNLGSADNEWDTLFANVVICDTVTGGIGGGSSDSSWTSITTNTINFNGTDGQIAHVTTGSDTFKVSDIISVTGNALTTGNLYIDSDDNQDDDIIYFSGTDESFMWDESDSRFELTDDLYSSLIITANSSLKSNGSVYANADGSSSEDAVVYFSGTSEYFGWDGTNRRFEFSDKAYVVDYVNAADSANAVYGLQVTVDDSAGMAFNKTNKTAAIWGDTRLSVGSGKICESASGIWGTVFAEGSGTITLGIGVSGLAWDNFVGGTGDIDTAVGVAGVALGGDVNYGVWSSGTCRVDQILLLTPYSTRAACSTAVAAEANGSIGTWDTAGGSPGSAGQFMKTSQGAKATYSTTW